MKKKTIYKVYSQKDYDQLMKDLEQDGCTWFSEHKPTELDYYKDYKEPMAIYVDENGWLTKSAVSEMTVYKDYSIVEYKPTPKIYPINFGCVGIDAPDFKTAYEAFRKRMLDIFGDESETNTYTVRVDGNETTVLAPDGKMATAKCHPEDEFDVVEGFRVALEKIRDSERKLTDEEFNVLNALQTLGCDTFRLDIGIEVIGFKNAIQVTCIDLDGDFDEVFNWLEDEEVYNIDELLDKYA